MLILFTDYGWNDPYVGQMKAVLAGKAPGVPVIDLLHSAPDFDPEAGAHLLAALCGSLPEGAVVLAVVDPGVGGPRHGAVLAADGRYYVGPDNGLLAIVAARAEDKRIWRIVWQPENLPPSFHGRDWFAPVAARIASNDFPHDWLAARNALDVQLDADDLPRILYVDHYGNCWTGLREGALATGEELEVQGQRLPWRRVFQDAAPGEAFWHVNSSGLIEISVNQGNAAQILGLAPGDAVTPKQPNIV